MSDASGYIAGLVLVGGLVWLCSEPRIYPESVRHAETVCAANGGWAYIEEGVSEYSSVTCENGAEFNYDWQKLESKK